LSLENANANRKLYVICNVDIAIEFERPLTVISVADMEHCKVFQLVVLQYSCM